MADISSIKVGSTTYTLKDSNAVHGTASSSNLGGIKLGYTQSGKNYPVSVDANGRAYVNVPWTDNQDLSGYVPTSRTVNGKALSSNISLTASDVGAAASSHTHDYVPTSRTVNGKALSSNISLTASDVGAASSGHNHDGTYLKSISAATSSAYGGIKLGYTQSGKNYPVVLDSNGKAYVNVPWEAGSGGSALPVQNYQYATGKHLRIGSNGQAFYAWQTGNSIGIYPGSIEIFDPTTGYTCMLDGDRLRRLLNLIGESY